MAYSNREFWEHRYGLYGGSPVASGTFSHSQSANVWFYRSKKKRIADILKKYEIKLCNRLVFDVACGSGQLINFFLNKGVETVVGVDISTKAIEICRAQFASERRSRFQALDIRDPLPEEFKEKFDLVCMFEAITGIVEEDKFIATLRNLCAATARGGYVLISDLFPAVSERRMDRLAHFSKSLYRQVFEESGIEIQSFTVQTAVFSTPVFPRRLQSVLERWLPATLYLLDRVCLKIGISLIRQEDRTFYCLGRKR
jgi:SAM-dependent methyltransferase